MGNDVIGKVLPGLPMIIAREVAICAVIVLLSTELIFIFCY